MNIKHLTFSVFLTAALAVTPAAYAADTSLAIEQMAEIILDLKSAPSKDAKLTLDDIAKDTASTEYERTLAASMMKMDKKIRPDDKPTILKLWINPAASEAERSIAKALLRFDEKADDESKAVLSQLVK